MKSVKSKLLKKLKSMKQIGIQRHDRVLHVKAGDWLINTKTMPSSISANSPKEKSVFSTQSSEIINVSDLIRDLENKGFEFDEFLPNKENIPHALAPRKLDPLSFFEERCPLGGIESVVLYTTSLRGVRKTFDECNTVRFLLQSFRIVYKERDVAMHREFREELWRVLGCRALPPRLFVKGRHLGGAEEVVFLHEEGRLRQLLKGIPASRSGRPCEGCAGNLFVLCFACSGGRKVISGEGRDVCKECNENGLLVCPICG